MEAHTPKFWYIEVLCVSAFIFFMLIPTQVQSAAIVVNSVIYDVTIFQGQSFASNSATLNNAPWWGDSTLAAEFASAYKTQLGVADTTSGVDKVYFGYAMESVYFERFNASIPLVNSAYVSESGGPAAFGVIDADFASSDISFAFATSAPSAVPEINAGSLSQALLILLALWLVVTRRQDRDVARVA